MTPSDFTMLNRRIFNLNRIHRRWLNLQEFQSKELMNKYGLITQKFKIVTNPCEAEMAANDLSNKIKLFSILNCFQRRLSSF